MNASSMKRSGWLRAIAPKARNGNSIYVYDLGGAGATSGSALR
jgi:hypothetical protein